MHIVDEGSGRSVVLLHAYPCDHTMWDAQAAALVAAGYRVLRPDLPGFGASPVAGEPPSLAAMARTLLASLDERGVAEFAVAGLSMGGYLAMDLLRQRPDAVSALALIDTKATADAEAARAGREETARTVEQAGSLEPLAEGMLQALLGPTTRSQRPAVVAQTRAFISATDPAGAAWAQRAMAARPDSLPTLAAFPRPAVVVTGDEDAMSSRSEHELMEQALPAAQLVVIEGCGHLSAIERPDAVSAALLQLLAQLP